VATVNVESDLRIILWIQAIRAFLYGFGAVILGSVLAASGARAFVAKERLVEADLLQLFSPAGT